MRYAFVSDIHANLQAWNAVCADTVAHQVDEVICLGDIVGYGPRPAETLRAVRAQSSRFTMGNHDAVVGGVLDASLFNDDAQKMILWTKRQLTKGAARFFREMPYTVDLDCGDFWGICVHGAMHPPESFYYVYTESDARMTWDACDVPLVFVGHTHEPKVDVLTQSGDYYCLAPENFEFQPGNRYIVNVGSVGLQRSEDERACYAIYDTETRVISWHRVEYDIAGFKRDVFEYLGSDSVPIHHDDDFSPSVVVGKRSVERARTRRLRLQEERLVKAPGVKKETKVMAIAFSVGLLILTVTCGLGFWVLTSQKGNDEQETLVQVEEEKAKPRSNSSSSSHGNASSSSSRDSTGGGGVVYNKRNPDFSKMPDLRPLKPPARDEHPPANATGADEDKGLLSKQSAPEINAMRDWLKLKVPESTEYQLLYQLDLAKLGANIVYDVDRKDALKGTPERIAYYLELKKTNGPSKFVYVSMDAFTADLKKMGIPVFGRGVRFQQPIAKLTVISNVDGLETGSDIDGNIEFWPNRYRPKNAANVPGASEKAYDLGDSITGSGPVNGYGSMQVHNTKASQTIFAINNWKEEMDADIGIGNSPGKNPDWTHTKSGATYAVKRLKVFVKTRLP